MTLSNLECWFGFGSQSKILSSLSVIFFIFFFKSNWVYLLAFWQLFQAFTSCGSRKGTRVEDWCAYVTIACSVPGEGILKLDC